MWELHKKVKRWRYILTHRSERSRRTYGSLPLHITKPLTNDFGLCDIIDKSKVAILVQ
jgi:hypothetical protein